MLLKILFKRIKLIAVTLLIVAFCWALTVKADTSGVNFFRFNRDSKAGYMVSQVLSLVFGSNATSTNDSIIEINGKVTVRDLDATNTTLLLNATSTGSHSIGELSINNAMWFTDVDGTNGQVLKTDGSGNITWSNDSTGAGGDPFWEHAWDKGIKPTSSDIGIFVNASSTVAANFRVDGNATTTGSLNVSSLNAASCDVMSDTNGLLYCGTNGAGGASGGGAWELFDTGSITPTTTNAGIFVNAPTSTILTLRVPDGLNATTTNVDDLVVYNNLSGTGFDNAWKSAYNATTTLNGFTNNQTDWNTAFSWGDHSVAGYLSETLTSAYFFVGNGSNVATVVAMSGDATIDNTGAIKIEKTSLDARNETGSQIVSTKAVYVSGFNNFPLLSLADNTDSDKHNVLGVTIAPINDSANGVIAISGEFDAETNAWTVGDELYLSTSGTLVNTEPTSGGVQHVGIVTVKENYPVGKILMYKMPEAGILSDGANTDTILRTGDNAGANKFSFRDYANNEILSINSDGLFIGTDTRSSTLNATNTQIDVLNVFNSARINVVNSTTTNIGTLHIFTDFTTDDTGVVANLNADLLDSQTGSYYTNWDNLTSRAATSTILSLLDSDYRILTLNATTSQIGTLTVYTDLGIATTTQDYKLSVNSSNATDKLFQVATTTNQGLMSMGLDGYLGLGMTNPNNRLQVLDLIDFDNTNFNTYIGYLAGGRDVAQYNTYLGYQAGYSGAGATNVADYNSAFGYQALLSNTTGNYNTTIGRASMQNNTTGFYNSTLGANSMTANTTGTSSAAFGMSSLTNNQTGSNNVAMGFDAGRYQSDGSSSLNGIKNSIYIGYNAKGNDNTDDNTIVIGTNAIANGINSVVLGNTDIVTTILRGDTRIPNLNATTSQIGNLTAYSLAILPDARLASLHSTSSDIDTLTINTAINLPAASIGDADLSSNICLLDRTGQVFTGDNRIPTLNATTTNIDNLTVYTGITLPAISVANSALVADYASFTYSTTTAWVGTTTIPLGTAIVAETWKAVQCFTDVGTVNVIFNDGTNEMNLLNASTTVGNVNLATNNSFTAKEKRYVDLGGPATSPTTISCTVEKTYD